MATATRGAADLVTAGIATQAADMGMALNEDAAGFVADTLGEPQAAPERGPVRVPAQAQTSAPAVAEETEPAELEPQFTLDPELPEDMRELLEEDDEPVEDADEPIEEPDPEDSYEDDETQKLRKRLKAAEKKVNFLDAQRVKTERKRWIAEAEKFFPLADAKGIEATSRRAYLKAASAQHDVLKEKFGVFLKASGFDAETERAKIRSEVEVEAKAAWGTPTTGPGIVPIEAGDYQRELADVRKTRDLAKILDFKFRRQEAAGR